MALERTLSIIKPDAVDNQNVGAIISRFEEAGFKILAQKMVRLDAKTTSRFYAEHLERPFFNDLIHYMTSGPIIVMVLEADNAIAKNRQLMGATDPAKASPGTIRADYAESIQANAVHGSDSLHSADREIKYFFSESDIFPR